MLYIGFTNKYFTLWDVSSRIDYDGDGRPTEKADYTYMQNLSIDEGQAIDKAREMGVTNLVPDPDLYGRNSSWTITKKLYSDFPRKISPWFEFGKNIGSLISECTDLKYLEYYYNECKNIHCLKILLNNEILFEYGGEIITESRLKRLKFSNKISKMTSVEVVFERNLNQRHLFDCSGGEGYGVFDDGNIYNFMFPEVKKMSYNGYDYCLPMIDGKGKKIKNKRLSVIGEVVKDNGGEYFLVDDFKLLKD